MNYSTTLTNKICLLLVFCVVLCKQATHGQEETNPNLNSNSTYHNQLVFNRFLINPTFSLVRENKSYLNIHHRNQYATFEDNSQNYFVGFSNKFNDHTAFGIGVYSQWSGVIQEFGFNANYATSVQLGAKSQLTFGANVTYFNEGLDKNRVVASENDPKILEARKESKVAIQPGITLSLGKFDFGLYATDLFKYNQSTNDFLTSFNDKSVKASLQYTHSFMATRGLFANARLMPLLQFGKNEDSSLAYVGSIVLDLPEYGWLQTTWDDNYGLSMGFGFNLNKKMSLGYLLEKDLLQDEADLGWNHELSLAYTFKNHNDGVKGYAGNSEDNKIDGIIRNYEEQILRLIADKNKKTDKDEERDKVKEKNKNEEDTNTLAYQNSLILDGLILRQDSIENARERAFEKRFETIVRILRSDIKHSIKSNLQDFGNSRNTALASNETAPKATPKTVFKAIPETLHKATPKTVFKAIPETLHKATPKTVFKAIPETLHKVTSEIALEATPETASETSKSLHVAEHKDYVKLPIKVLNQSDIIGVKSGYYVIANVYKNKKWLNAFMDNLSEQGLDAKQFYNKENGLYYVYLADFNFKKDAETAFVSNLNGKYRDEKWIMQVDNSTATAVNMYED